MKDYYRILDIPFNSDQIEVEKAYQRLKSLIIKNSVSLYSILPSSEKNSFLNDIEEAYQTLADPYKRSNYDSILRGESSIITPQRNPDIVKQLSFSFAREAFTFLDYTSKSEQLYDKAINRIRNDYLIHSEGLSIKIIEENSTKVSEDETNIGKFGIEIKTENQAPITSVEVKKEESLEKESERKEVLQSIDNSKIDVKENITPCQVEPTPLNNIAPEIKTETEPTVAEREKILTPIIVDENSEFSGDFLRQIRESMGLSIKDVAQTTKISTSNIKYLEEEDYQNLPALVYIKGYLAQIAKCLNLRPDVVVRSYIARMNDKTEKKR